MFSAGIRLEVHMVFDLCYGMLSYVLLCCAWMGGGHVRVVRCSFIQFHGCDGIYGSEFLVQYRVPCHPSSVIECLPWICVHRIFFIGYRLYIAVCLRKTGFICRSMEEP